ncbi:TPA: phage major tail tube protein [Pseudomonas aeruginosa]|uniref:phage major tail tube protein n=1 Tax=Pseudomonas aeruginosa TaxID=287 RepID=UPI0009A2AFCD|nr:phage major tail tube protein [Pseudomonas aeruginosa]EIU5460386.1 phage major tail tube protein [Pseudomonas aeruginosa]EIU5543769.1 phage major tail tube protein [Pseudomonas aeruginosa]EKW4494359.1 phage major tail tube protein [Pseudomonas aeruginosa]EKY0078192.1 phage major tail tube protein [Pseudomonas aeruginosa]EKY0500318.1 phage major tail tube protein [Pseudomonas aeruginosa]
MGARLPSVLVDMNAFFQDQSFAGLCNALTLPKIVTKTMDAMMSGTAGEVERDLGRLEKMEAEVTISDYPDKVTDLIGSRASRDEVFTIRGAIDRDGVIKTVIVKMQGFWKSLEFNEWKPESEATEKFGIAVEFFSFEVDGKERIYVDKLNNIFRVNGKDRNKEIRQALGQ